MVSADCAAVSDRRQGDTRKIITRNKKEKRKVDLITEQQIQRYQDLVSGQPGRSSKFRAIYFPEIQ